MNLWLVYVLIALTNVATSFFSPSSTYLIKVHVVEERKQRFNALYATLNAGAFMVGPALAGALLIVFSPSIVIWINGFTFFLCAALLSLLSKDPFQMISSEKVTWQTLKADYALTWTYARQQGHFTRFVLIYSIALMMAYALDSQEMTFLFTHLSISESLYGVTVTIAGIGAVVGGICATLFAKKVSAERYVKIGFFLTMVSYFGFYMADRYWFAVICFVTLGFFMAFSNAGFDTLYQRAIVPTLVGRVTSMLLMMQSVLQVLLTALIGLFAQWWSLQATVAICAGLAVCLAIWLIFMKITSKTAISLSTSFDHH